MKKFDAEYVNEMKAEFVAILSTVEREGITDLINWLEESDFYEAPASSKYHNAFPSGLLDHVINTYYNLKSLVYAKGLDKIIDEESIIICGLLHDLDKVGLYEKGFKNVKKYHDGGKKKDEGGKFDWVVEESYFKKDRDFYYGNHETNSVYLIRQYINLTKEEEMAIMHHHGGKGYDSMQVNLTPIWDKTPLAILLHVADMLSTFVDESEDTCNKIQESMKEEVVDNE